MDLCERSEYVRILTGDVFDHSSYQSVVVNETVVYHSQEAETVLKDDGFNELSSFTREHWNAYQLDLQENIFVAMAWVYSGDLRLLKLFPSVVIVVDTVLTIKLYLFMLPSLLDSEIEWSIIPFWCDFSMTSSQKSPISENILIC